jgi:uncharacterized protein YxeA
MEYIYIILLLVFILLVVFAYYLIINIHIDKNEKFTEIIQNKNYWNRNKCKYSLNRTVHDELEKYNINKNSDKWNIYFPCSYDNPSKEIEEMPTKQGAKYFIIDNIDNIVAKEWLWKNIVKHHGILKAENLMPKSYALNNDDDIYHDS